ncbi:hypothetical protein ACWCRG_43075, partial [Streptomyces formicae]
MNSRADADLEINLHDYEQPIARPGIYRFRADQVLKDKNGGQINTAPLTAEESYELRAVRFYLDPASAHACYPAVGASGDFSLVLPHLTLNRAVLPWERWLSVAPRDADAAEPEPRPPWVWLMLIGEDEVADDPQAR